jgi:hypothetical protein
VFVTDATTAADQRANPTNLAKRMTDVAAVTMEPYLPPRLDDRPAEVAAAAVVGCLADHFAEHGGIFGAAQIVFLRRLEKALTAGPRTNG